MAADGAATKPVASRTGPVLGFRVAATVAKNRRCETRNFTLPIYIQDAIGNTPLHQAAAGGNLEQQPESVPLCGRTFDSRIQRCAKCLMAQAGWLRSMILMPL